MSELGLERIAALKQIRLLVVQTRLTQSTFYTEFVKLDSSFLTE